MCAYNILVKGLVVLDGLGERYVDNFVVAQSYHDVSLSFEQRFDGCYAQTTCKDAVAGCGAATTLQITEDRDAHIELGEFHTHFLGNLHDVVVLFAAFGKEHDTAALGAAQSVRDELVDFLEFGVDLDCDRDITHDGIGQYACLGSSGNCTVKGKETGVASHYLYNEQALV